VNLSNVFLVTMGDREANEGQADGPTWLMNLEEHTVEEMDLHSVTTADSSGGIVTGTEGNTAAHQSVLSGFQEGDTNAVCNRDIVELIEWQGTTLNQPDAQGYTEIGRALKQLDKTRVESMLKDSSARPLHLDYYPGDCDSTVREIIKQKYPDLQLLLPEPITESLNSSDRDIKLLAALQHDEYDIFSETLGSNNHNPCYGEPYHSSLLEIACQGKNKELFVEKLLQMGADPNTKNQITHMPLIHATAKSGNLVVLEMLLGEEKTDIEEKDNEGRTILHWWARVSEKNPDDNKKLDNCFKCILKKDSIKYRSFNEKDSSDSTPFSTAVRRGYSDRWC